MSPLIKSNKIFILLSCLVLLSGCADWYSEPVRVDDDFGKSVKHMMKAQTVNPTPTEQAFGMDGQKAEGAIKAYRSGGIDLKHGKETLTFDVDN